MFYRRRRKLRLLFTWSPLGYNIITCQIHVYAPKATHKKKYLLPSETKTPVGTTKAPFYVWQQKGTKGSFPLFNILGVYTDCKEKGSVFLPVGYWLHPRVSCHLWCGGILGSEVRYPYLCPPTQKHKDCIYYFNVERIILHSNIKIFLLEIDLAKLDLDNVMMKTAMGHYI